MTQERTRAEIMNMLLDLSDDERKDVWHDIAFNPIFCVHCGYGSRADPNPNCQCTNDE